MIPRLSLEPGWRQRLKLRELLCFSTDEQFLDNAYRVLLGREPDESGVRHYQGYLDQWGSRLVVIYEIVRSHEGRSRGVQVDGIGWIAIYQRMRGKRLVLPLLLKIERHYLRRFPELLIRSEGDWVRRQVDRANRVFERSLRDCVGDIDSRLEQVQEGMRNAGVLAQTVEGLSAEMVELRGGLASLEQQADALGGEVRSARSTGDWFKEQISALGAHTDELRGNAEWLQRQFEGLAADMAELRGGSESLRERAEELRRGNESLQHQVEKLGADTDELRGGAEWLQRQIDDLSEQGTRTRQATETLRRGFDERVAWRERLSKDIDFIRSDLIFHRTQVHDSLQTLSRLVPDLSFVRTGPLDEKTGDARPRQETSSDLTDAPEASGDGTAIAASSSADAVAHVADLAGRFDGFYLAFEDAFRGSQEQIRATQEIYLADIIAAGAGGSEDPVLDLGCGRGEWLSVLKEQGLHARGVDTSAAMVERCRNRGLCVEQRDAARLLADLPNESLGAVTAFHLIEHLPFPLLHDLIEQAHRALRPGGLLVLETPNPENLLVGSHTFYHDPTHRNPMTPAATRFLVRYFGFEEPRIRRLHPYPEDARVPGNDPLTERVNGHLCGPQDFAMIARRPVRAD